MPCRCAAGRFPASFSSSSALLRAATIRGWIDGGALRGAAMNFTKLIVAHIGEKISLSEPTLGALSEIPRF